MAILNNCELHYLKADPKKPSAKFSKDNPTWEVQIRTYSKEQKREWVDLKLNVTTVDPDEGPVYYSVNLKKKSIKPDGSPANPVNVVDGDLKPLDPNIVGYGSKGNVRIYQSEYTSSDGTKAIRSTLMSIQITTLKQYIPKEGSREDFEKSDMEVLAPDDAENLEEPPLF